MRNRLVLGLMTAVMTIGIMAMSVAPALADDQGNGNATGDPDGSIALAERMATFAHQILREEHLPAKALDLSAALYDAAMALNPNESRFPRALADICFELKDNDRAVKALKAYINLQPADQTAFVQLLDLYLASPAMQSVDQRLNYLRGKLQVQQIPGPVRSEMAYRCAKLYLQRSQTDQALRMLEAARTLNPMNLRALRMRYVMTQADALPVDRVTQLLGIMQANPADPVVASRLAEQLAQLGMVDQAISWYGLANRLYAATGDHPDPAFVLGASSELLVGNHPDEASSLISKYLEVLPEDADGWFVQLSVAKMQLALDPADQQMQAQYAGTIKKASIAITNRLQEIRKLAGDSTATTRPLDSDTAGPLPDLSGDAAMLKKARNSQLLSPYLATVSSLASLDLYYSHDGAAADPLIAAIAQLVPAKDITLQRLRAWRQYVGGDAAGAVKKLRDLAKDDPLAGLGVVMIDAADPAKKAQVPIEAQKLIDDHPAGVVGAVLWAELSQYHVKIDPSPASGSIATLVNNVPEEFLALITQPKSYYQIDVSPLKSSFNFGEPILVRVTLQNVSDVDLAIGNDAAIHPQLWFDAFLRGISNKAIPGAAIGRLDQRLVLGPGDMVSTIVRVDQDALYPYFYNSPSVDLLAKLALVTNPTQLQKGSDPNQPGQATPGLGGYVVRASDLIAREPVPIETDAQRNQLFTAMAQGDGGDKIRLMQVLSVYIGILRADKDPGALAVVKDFMARLRKVEPSESPSVQAWHRMLLAQLSGDDELGALTAMAGNSSWQMRLLALEAARQSLGTKAIPLAQQLGGDQNPIVREYAVALAQSLQAAATQPSENAAPPPVGNATQ
jgi:tetratricopeptide (TPR) repeat protein